MIFEDLKAFAERLDRAYFIDNEYKQYADYDQPLPIGYEQTISQPSLVFQMTYILSPEKGSRVLEIGTGSGYQTALLAEFSGEVYTIERISALAEKAKKRLLGLGYTNISFMTGDGSLGWEEHAPYDRIMVTAAAAELPQELLRQLAAGGRMVIPVGPRGCQELMLVEKDINGEIFTRIIEEVVFVELKGKYGWSYWNK
ncbi:protein-L-isoaspartate(D-aspartate) O-methyltransferase [Youngiibacter multivorans]|uniref:Protein-L-isoaspartate O-methyltransferase n=1 Tax=Youngiibacter multivorans TaxID=937251 RepID=A0ABS4G8R3_9CLOT|nr:protein-L-isoaspartate(D-aspartate) O-methyltransferase [Youngiibacter multivorans]MBP1920953.1 protein-L-isoaspartate(D-aspartate) O-methyltransferase [Youngiibacter multivorans]